MIASLLGSTLAFILSTTHTQNRILEQQITADVDHARKALLNRAEVVTTVADLLANDPTVIEALPANTDASLSSLNKRTLVTRDRFELDLIQIYNQQGEARANLVLSKLYRQSSLLDLVEADTQVVRIVENRMLLLSRATTPNGTGTVITGIDLETELHRIVNQDDLGADLGLRLSDMQVGTRKQLTFDVPNGWNKDQYTQHEPLTFGDTSLELLVTRQTTDITTVTQAGLLIMIGSTLVTTLLLLIVGIVVTRSITRPVHRLAVAAQGLANGNLSQQVEEVTLPRPFGIGDQDEIGLLTQAFKNMVVELRELYQELESKVEARTKQLAAAAHVARATSSSLDLEVVLRTSVEILSDHFGFYHVSIFIIEPGSNTATLCESSSKVGYTLKKHKHRLDIGSKSLVGIATATRQPRIVQDVTTDPDHQQNPLLPSTRAEAVIPLISRDAVIGALDVQSTEVNAFSPDVVELLMTLADQIAIAIQNARFYARQKETAEHLARANQLKTEFLTTMSHELRTPLNSIIGFSQVILEEIDGPLTEMQKADLVSIHSSGQHLLGLINDVLDLMKIEAGQLELNFEEVDLKNNIQAVVSAASELIKNKPIIIEQKVPDKPLIIQADNTRVRQVLLNLLSNAVKFTETGKITVTVSQNNGHVVVNIADTGIGIPPEKLLEVFSDFTQVDSSSTRRFGGMGLGLPIAKKLIELHGGRIWAALKPDHKGSVLSFTLPMKQLR
jgi:signal transduction histidine kinase